MNTLLVVAPALTYSDLAKLYILKSEAATTVLPQIVDGYKSDVACYSKSHAPSSAEQLSYEKAASGVVLTVNHSRSYFYDIEFRLRMNHVFFI